MVFYEPGKTDHGLPRDPFKSCVVPRPIGWISTRNPKTGVDNLAPYSQFNNLTFDPPYVMFSANQDHHGERKNTVTNAETSGVFCWNIATWDLREAVNLTASFSPDSLDEFASANLTKVPGQLVNVPMVAASPIRFECEYHTTLRLPGNPPMGSVDVVIGKVVGIHIDERVLTEGKVDLGKVLPIARCGYYEYAVIRGDALFEMVVPGGPEMLVGLEGSVKGQKAMVGKGEGEDGEGEDGAAA